MEGGRVVRNDREGPIQGTRGELVIGHLAFRQHAVDRGLGASGIGEVVLERRTDQLIAGGSGQLFRLLVDVGDDAARIGGHHRIDVGFDQRARVEMLVAQPLVELHALFFHLLARGVVGADQQVADDPAIIDVSQRGNRHDGREPAAVFADVRQLVNVFDSS